MEINSEQFNNSSEFYYFSNKLSNIENRVPNLDLSKQKCETKLSRIFVIR